MTLPSPKPTSTALVTGASSGIGDEIARELARRGHGLTLVARREDKLLQLATELQDQYEIRVEVIACDLTDEVARGDLPEKVEAMGLIVDILVNNAGFSTMGPVHTSTRAAQLAMIRTDVEAVVDLCTLFVPGMTTRRRGAVLNTASTAAFQPLPGQAGYGASKAFVLSYGRALRAELNGTGVAVTTLCPGPVDTGFGEAAGLTQEESLNALPKFMWIPTAEVAKAGIEGLDQDKGVVIPGAANWVGAMAAQLAPKEFLAGMLAKQHPALNRK